MTRAANLRTGIMAWLLCVMVTLFALMPATCPACDGISFTHQFASPTHTAAAAISCVDSCDGACSCCLLQAVPAQFQVITTQEPLSDELIPSKVQPELVRPSTFFRPPRISSAL
jgi:hypothetical protein